MLVIAYVLSVLLSTAEIYGLPIKLHAYSMSLAVPATVDPNICPLPPIKVEIPDVILRLVNVVASTTLIVIYDVGNFGICNICRPVLGQL